MKRLTLLIIAGLMVWFAGRQSGMQDAAQRLQAQPSPSNRVDLAETSELDLQGIDVGAVVGATDDHQTAKRSESKPKHLSLERNSTTRRAVNATSANDSVIESAKSNDGEGDRSDHQLATAMSETTSAAKREVLPAVGVLTNSFENATGVGDDPLSLHLRDLRDRLKQERNQP